MQDVVEGKHERYVDRDPKRAAQTALDAAFDIVGGDYIGAARKLINGALDLVPSTVVREVITQEQARRQNALAEELENDTFGDDPNKIDEQ